MNKYEIIYDALQEKVNNDILTVEQAEEINDLAYAKYVLEDGHSKNLKKRHDMKKKNIEARFKKNLNYERDHIDDDGTEHGTVKVGDGRRVPLKIDKYSTTNYRENKYNSFYNVSKDEIRMHKNAIQMKGSDIVGSHEYSHAMDDKGKTKKDIERYNSSLSDGNYINKNFERRIEKQDKKGNIQQRFNDEKQKLKDKTGRELNEHDSQTNEIRADIKAIKHINPEHGGNMHRKNLNELDRRMIQPQIQKRKNKSLSDESKSYIDCMKNVEYCDGKIKHIKDIIKKIQSRNSNDSELIRLNRRLQLWENSKKSNLREAQKHKVNYKNDKKHKIDMKDINDTFDKVKQQNADRTQIASKLAKD